MNRPQYTIADLIKALETFPPDMPVITNGYEEEYENIMLPKKIKVEFSPNQPYYTGQFVAAANGEETFEAVLIAREVRDFNN